MYRTGWCGAIWFAALILLAADAAAQQPTPSPAPSAGRQSSRPFEITDNSFLVEEAFNQERGIFQNIATYSRIGSGWTFSFTQEWPAPAMRHQISYTVPALSGDGFSGVGDALINYRLQAMEEGPGRPAFSPRVSVILPTGDPDHGTGDGVVGWQFNLPFSKQVSDFYFHWNAGATILPREHSASGVKKTLTSPSVAASVIWRVKPMVNLLIENVGLWIEQLDDAGVASRAASYTLSPGIRGGWNVGDKQVIVGLAAPVVWTASRVEAGGFLYFSYELPFRR